MITASYDAVAGELLLDLDDGLPLLSIPAPGLHARFYTSGGIVSCLVAEDVVDVAFEIIEDGGAGPVGDDIRAYMGKVERHSRRIEALVTELLHLARAHAASESRMGSELGHQEFGSGILSTASVLHEEMSGPLNPTQQKQLGDIMDAARRLTP